VLNGVPVHGSASRSPSTRCSTSLRNGQDPPGLPGAGVEVALDDFGTGFASMTELKNLPVNVLKLDLSFVQGITHDIYDRAIVESIIRLAVL